LHESFVPQHGSSGDGMSILIQGQQLWGLQEGLPQRMAALGLAGWSSLGQQLWGLQEGFTWVLLYAMRPLQL